MPTSLSAESRAARTKAFALLLPTLVLCTAGTQAAATAHPFVTRVCLCGGGATGPGSGQFLGEDPQRMLWIAAMLGDEDTCAMLLAEGADPNLPGYYPGDDAGEDGADALAQAFAAQNSTGCPSMQEMNPNALHMAAIGGHDAVVERLLGCGALVNAPTSHGYTALHLAALMGHASLCRVLIASGADVGAVDMFGDQAIDCAGTEDRAEVHALLEQAMVAAAVQRTSALQRNGDNQAAGLNAEHLLSDLGAVLNGSVWSRLKAGEDVIPRCLTHDQGKLNGVLGPLAERLQRLRDQRIDILNHSIAPPNPGLLLVRAPRHPHPLLLCMCACLCTSSALLHTHTR